MIETAPTTMFVHAVKALIYRRDGRMLLQKRDDKPGLPFPGRWTLFGGRVEEGENLEAALSRELVEELGCMPGPAGAELFQWDWHGVDSAHNHFFPVRCEVPEETLMLNEGHAMNWFAMNELSGIQTTPLIEDNMQRIANFLQAEGLPQ